MSAKQQPQNQDESANKESDSSRITPTRRGLMRGGTATVIGLGAMAGGDEIHPDLSPVQNGEAIGATAIAAGVAALYAYERWGDQVVEKITDDSTEEQVWWSCYSIAVTTQGTAMVQVDEAKSSLKLVKNGLYADVKKATIDALNAGKDKSTANQDAQDLVYKHTEDVEKSLLENYRILGRQIQTIWQDSKDAGIGNEIETDGGETLFQPNWFDAYDRAGQIISETFTTGQGEEYDIVDVDLYSDGSYGWNTTNATMLTTGEYYGPTLVDPNGQTFNWGMPQVGPVLTDIRAERDSVLSEVSTIVDEIYSNYQPGELESVTSSRDMIRRRLDDEADDGVAAYATAAELGYQTNAEADYTIEYRERSNGELSEPVEWSGVMLADTGTFSNPIQTGNTYDTQDLSGNVYFLFNTGSSDKTQKEQLTGQFTVKEIIGDNGEQLEQVKQQNNNFATRDTSNLDKQLENITERRQAVDNRDSLPTNLLGENGLFGGGSGIPGLSEIPKWVLAIPVIGGIIAAFAVIAE